VYTIENPQNPAESVRWHIHPGTDEVGGWCSIQTLDHCLPASFEQQHLKGQCHEILDLRIYKKKSFRPVRERF
jgi:hypothetical protein